MANAGPVGCGRGPVSAVRPPASDPSRSCTSPAFGSGTNPFCRLCQRILIVQCGAWRKIESDELSGEAINEAGDDDDTKNRKPPLVNYCTS